MGCVVGVMKKIGVLGHFGFGKTLLNGQTIKTKNVTQALEEVFGESQVIKRDTHGGVSSLFLVPFQIIELLNKCENIIIFPAQNGVRVIVPLLVLFNTFFQRKLHYVVIGGWLPSLCKSSSILIKLLNQLDVIYVETLTMKRSLEGLDFKNVEVMHNFKNIKPLEVPISINNNPHLLCTFSRVMKEKGIEDAIKIVDKLNSSSTQYELHIYGQIEPSQMQWFEKLKSQFPDYVSYCGLIPYDQSVDVLKQYDVLLFPTSYDGEGFAGTLLDSMAAGVPIVASNWKYNNEIVNNNSGILVEVGNIEMYCNAVNNLINNYDMRCSALSEAQKYLPRNAISPLLSNLT